MYGYWWGYTKAQIELLMIDQPLVVYDHDEKKEKGKFKKANPLDVIRAGKEWQEKYEGKEDEKIKIDFSNFGMTASENINKK